MFVKKDNKLPDENTKFVLPLPDWPSPDEGQKSDYTFNIKQSVACP